MFAQTLDDPLDAISEAELARLVRVADPLLAGRPLLSPGHRPTRARAGQGVEFLDHQEYAVGDDLRSIDWRATARCRHPQIRRFRNERAADWFVCLDRSASMSFVNHSKWRLGVQLAASLSYLLLHLGNRVGLMLFSSDVDTLLPPGRGHFQYARVAAALRNSAPRASGGGSQLRRCSRKLAPRTPVLVISDFLAEDGMQTALTGLLAAGRTVQALQVVDDAEVDLRSSGTLTLRDAESQASMTLDLSDDGAASAAASLARLQDDLATCCRSKGIPFTACQTGDGWKKSVIRHLKHLGAGDA
ncbi:MAG: DUF58 domain-containing protein [Gammaproteobacteria bacterium]|nr:MAG: DUF58 domain-containing protein [Gammaproteobacteria bacterium]